MIAAAAILLALACPDEVGPFQAADLVPADVRVYVHLENAAALRAEVVGRPLARWAVSQLGRGQILDAWQRVADAVGVDGGALFDETLGRRVTVVARGGEWAVLTEIEPARSAALIQRLRPRVLAPVRRQAVVHLPDHELVLATSGRQVLVGPWTAPGLFDQLLGHLAVAPRQSLGSTRPLVEARALGGGCAGLYLRHEPPLGGWSVAVAGLQDDRILVRHSALFENPPFSRPAGERTWALGPLRALERRTILTLMEPAGSSGGPLDAFLQVELGHAAMPAAMRANLGPRRITTVADEDGRLADPPFDMQLPTAARVWEVRDPQRAWQQLDRRMVLLVERLNGICPDRPLQIPDLQGRRPRCVDAGPAARWLLGDLPGADRISLNWTVTSGPTGHWSVVASSPRHLAAVCDALNQAPEGSAEQGQWSSCGSVDGQRLAGHLRSWRQQVGALAGAGGQKSPSAMNRQWGPQPELATSLRLVSELADGVKRCRWRLSRPSTQRMRLEAEIELAEPVSERRR